MAIKKVRSRDVKEKEYDFSHAEIGKYARRDAAIPKTCITLYLDNDVLGYFKRRVATPNAAPYQTQINNELRALMERATTGRDWLEETLVNDEACVEAVEGKLKARPKRPGRY